MVAREHGFTLVEAVIVMVVTGILAGIVAVFISSPVQGYVDTARRAELTDVADTALRRIARDLRLALPNSVRATTDAAGNRYLEYVPTCAGGRYRTEKDPSKPLSDPLDFAAAAGDSSFDILGPAITFLSGACAGANWIVVYNLGVPGADAYEGTSRASYTGGAGALTSVTIGAKRFPFESPGNRFQVVQAPVSYVCSPTATGGDGTLRRFSGYGFSSAQPTAFGVAGPLLATNVSACSMVYTPGVTERSGLVAMQLTITRDGESVTLMQQVHLSNVP